MPVRVHELTGCTPEPLAAYLKGLAALRLVAEQRDRAARGFWRGDRFHLVTSLDRDELVDFYLRFYRPTPLVTPWNGGSGFYPKDKKDGIDAISAGGAERFAPYRAIIESARELIGDRDQAPGDDKAALIRACRRTWRGSAESWLDAALVLGSDGRVRFPALLGTGGNDGRLDFANNQMQRLVELISPETGEPLPNAESLLNAALFGAPVAVLSRGKPIGQFSPGAAGGANATMGYSGDSLINPWDYVLMLEGALVLRVAAVRRLGSDELPQASAPFAVKAQASGYASATAVDESARGEQWMPLWTAPAGLAEVRALFGEGRLQSGRRRARRAIDAARAVARLGTTRGVQKFVRFGFIERNGQSNLAVPLGTWDVALVPHVELLDEIDPWVDSLRRASHKRAAPASLGRDVRLIERAILAVCREYRPQRWAELLAALGRAEDSLLTRAKATVSLRLQPLPPLSPGWLAAAGDDSAEFHLAAALASQYAMGDDRHGLGPIRVHCLPLARGKNKRYTNRFAIAGDSVARDRRVVWTGLDLVSDLGAIAARRLLDCRQASAASFELRGRYHATFGDIEAFLAGEVRDELLAGMARALMAVNWAKYDDTDGLPKPTQQRQRFVPSPLYALFRLLYRPRGRDDRVSLDPAPMRLLLAGRLGAAADHALRRVAESHGRPKIYRALGSPDQARRLAASLCFPIRTPDMKRLASELCRIEQPPSDATP